MSSSWHWHEEGSQTQNRFIEVPRVDTWYILEFESEWPCSVHRTGTVTVSTQTQAQERWCVHKHKATVTVPFAFGFGTKTKIKYAWRWRTPHFKIRILFWNSIWLQSRLALPVPCPCQALLLLLLLLITFCVHLAANPVCKLPVTFYLFLDVDVDVDPFLFLARSIAIEQKVVQSGWLSVHV